MLRFNFFLLQIFNIKLDLRHAGNPDPTPPKKEKIYLLNFTIQFSRKNLLNISENERKAYLPQEEEERKNGHTQNRAALYSNFKKKCMARNYTQSPFQVTVHQKQGILRAQALWVQL